MEEKQAPKRVYPEWVRALAQKYRSKTLCQYMLHGNIYDFVPVKEGDKTTYSRLRTFLSDELFRNGDIVVFYDRSSGIRFKTPQMKADFKKTIALIDQVQGTDFSKILPRNPTQAFVLLEYYFTEKLKQDPKFSIAFIIEYAETIVPAGTASYANSEDRAILVTLTRWATEGLFKTGDVAIVLVAENTINLNQQMVKNPYTYEVNVPYPSEDERLMFIQQFCTRTEMSQLLEMSPDVLAKNTAGLNLANLDILLSEIAENKIKFTHEDLNRKKKEIIESEAGGLLEFVRSKYDLTAVAGHKYAKQRLVETAQAIRNGRPDVVPMGFLVSGPVGTGKTFLITCFANDIGVPMVILKNFRSKWQGETESNLEKVLNLLRAMTPVAVMIDEADAYLGDRSSDGDSGVSSRVFSMIASFMSNTDNRGKVIWFLVTARPDLMPVDFKRQGRAEEHIALFYPETLEEKKELFQVVLKKTGLKDLKPEDFDDAFYDTMTVKSGAEMEAALTRSKFRAAAESSEKVTPAHVKAAMEDFLPPSYPEEIELQNFAAVLECTSKSLLPERYRALGRGEVVAKVRQLQALIHD